MDTINAVPNSSNPARVSHPITPASSDYPAEVTALSHKVQKSLTFPSRICVGATSATASITSDTHEYTPESLNQKQVQLAKFCEVKTGAEKTPAEFKKEDRLIVYPTNPDRRDGHGTNILIDPTRLLDDMDYDLYVHSNYELDSSDWKITADSILQRLPPDFKEFLNRDWSAKERWLLTPEEYQPLARFHWAIAGFEEYDYARTKYSETERSKELVNFFEEVSLPLRDGWSEDEIKFLEFWLGSFVSSSSMYYVWDEFRQYMDFCLKGALDAGCISFCDNCVTTMIENRETYERIKSLEQQLANARLALPMTDQN